MTDDKTRPERPNAPQYPYPDDEISLVDLWLVLMRRKWWIVGVAAACIGAGLAYALVQKPEQRYLSVVEIGRYVDGGGNVTALESREALATRLRESILPALRHEKANEWGIPMREIPEVSVRVPDEESPGEMVFLHSQISVGAEGSNAEQEAAEELRAQEIIQALHDTTVDRVQEAHSAHLDTRQERFQSRLARQRIEVEALEAERAERRQELEAALEEAEFRLQAIQEEREPRWQELEHAIETVEDEIEALEDDRDTRRRELDHAIEMAEAEVEALEEEREARRQELEHAIEVAQAEIEDLHEEQESRRQQLKHATEAAEADVERIAASGEQLEHEMEQLDKRQAFLRERRDVLQQLFSDLWATETSELGGRSGEGGLAVGLLFSRSKAVEVQEQLRQVQEELTLGLDQRRMNLRAELSDNARERRSAERRLAEQRQELDRFERAFPRRLVVAEQELSLRRAELSQMESEMIRQIRRAELEAAEQQAQLGQMESESLRQIRRAEQRLAARRTDLQQFENEHPRRLRAAERDVAERELALALFGERFGRELESARQGLREMETQANFYQPTMATAVALPTDQEGAGRSLIVALSLVLGLMLGVFAAFFGEFNARARQEARERGEA